MYNKFLFQVFSIASIGAIMIAHQTGPTDQLKTRAAASRLYKDRCIETRDREIAGKVYFKGDVVAFCQVCDVFDDLKNGKSMPSKEEIKARYLGHCIQRFSKEFDCSSDDRELIKFCSQEGDDFVLALMKMLEYERNK